MLHEPFAFGLLVIEHVLCSYDQIYCSVVTLILKVGGCQSKVNLKKRDKNQDFKGQLHGSALIADTRPHSNIHSYVKIAFERAGMGNWFMGDV